MGLDFDEMLGICVMNLNLTVSDFWDLTYREYTSIVARHAVMNNPKLSYTKDGDFFSKEQWAELEAFKNKYNKIKDKK